MSKNLQIRQARTKCKGWFEFFLWFCSMSLCAHKPTIPQEGQQKETQQNLVALK